MKWNNLKNNKCPNCANVYLTRAPFSSTADYYCDRCNFRISAAKFDSVINSLYKPRAHYSTPEDNLSALNNFGHKGTSKDYSDEIEKL